ncbi:Na(+)/H(+) exchanger protein 7-like [Ylistrum balloti]|uniref:Na(+)/H(+) exchanger protein 7-like n=1 Tax=Ylistrum balloti TaxID=509963 RepID=UPI002905CD4D|nr:Na(+)/H(+) exchanger protein 7-like [Ylistrum balloti]
MRLFADDVILYITVRDPCDQQMLQKDLTKLAEWESCWGMLFHPEKCSVLNVSCKRNIPRYPFKLKGTTLENNTIVTYLGVDLTSTLSWSHHIDRISGKTSRTQGFLRRNLKISSEETKSAAYRTTISVWKALPASVAEADSPGAFKKGLAALRALAIMERNPLGLLPFVLLFFFIISSTNSSTTTFYNTEQISHSSTGTTNPDHEVHPSNHSSNHTEHEESHGHHVEVVEIRYEEISSPFLFTVVVLVAVISKMGFHYANKLSSIVPESCLLIIVGTVFGTIIYFSGSGGELQKFFTPETFFHYLLPPIILESAFNLYDRTFTENIGSILIFAVFGTIAACLLLGLSLIGLQMTSAMPYVGEPVQLLVFSALIVAVDPVAVLAVFNEVGVNRVLYFLVFGESLLNDGVTVVLYHVLQSYNLILQERDITAEDIVLGFVKFFLVCFGGLFIGVIIGALSSILTKYTNNVKVIEPVVIFGTAYIAFLLAEMFAFSGIISIIACGIVQVAYAFANITKKSRVTVKFFTKVLSTISEIIIFLFLGLFFVQEHSWNTALSLWTVLFITVYRFGVTFLASSLINRFDKYRVRKIRYDEMFIVSYGGIRGAVCFSLVALLDIEAFPMKDIFITSTLFVIFFTVFIQGSTIKPLVRLLQVKLAAKTKETSMYVELTEHVTDHLMAGMEDLIGKEGKNSMREWFYHMDEKYIRRFLLRDHNLNEEQYEILQCYEKLMMKEHYKNLHLCGASQLPEDANRLRNIDSRALIQQIKSSTSGKDNDYDMHLPEHDDDSPVADALKVTFSLEDTPNTPAEARHFFDKHIQRPVSHMNVYGFSKGLQDPDRIKNRKLTRMFSIREQWSNKRNNNLQLERLKTIRKMPERAMSWSEENTEEVQFREQHRQAPRQRAMTMNNDGSAVAPLNKMYKESHNTVIEVDENTHFEGTENEPLMDENSEEIQKNDSKRENSDTLPKSESVDRHGQLTRQGAVATDDIALQPVGELKRHRSLD